MRLSVLPYILLWVGLSLAVPHGPSTRTSTRSTISGTPTCKQNLPSPPYLGSRVDDSRELSILTIIATQAASKTPVPTPTGTFPFGNGTLLCRAAHPDVWSYKQGDLNHWMSADLLNSTLEFGCKDTSERDVDGGDYFETLPVYSAQIPGQPSRWVNYKTMMGWYWSKPGCEHYKKTLGDVEKCKKLWMPYVKKCTSPSPLPFSFHFISPST